MGYGDLTMEGVEPNGRPPEEAEPALTVAAVAHRLGIAPVALEHMMRDRPAVDQNQSDQHLRVTRLAIPAVTVGADLRRSFALEIGRVRS